MNHDRIFNRLGGLLDQGKGRLNIASDHLQERLRREEQQLEESAKAAFVRAQDGLASMEERVARTMRENQQMLLFAGIAFACMVIVSSILSNRRRQDTDW